MADEKITDLDPADLPLDPTDLFEVVQDVGGTPVNRQIAAGDLPGGSGSSISTTDAPMIAEATTAAVAGGTDTATADLHATDSALDAVVRTQVQTGDVARVEIRLNGVVVFSAVGDGIGADQLGWFGSVAAQQTFDSGDTDTNRIAALEALVVAYGLGVDTA